MSWSRPVHYGDDNPGIRRVKRGRGFSYIGLDGERITDPDTLQTLKALAVPPAYTDVWISPEPNGHLLFTGRDADGRKQARYHPDWTALQDRLKFEQLATLPETLPRLRRWITRTLAVDALNLDTMVAASLALIDRGAFRPGAQSYAVENGSVGATTIKTHHVEIETHRCVFRFPGKGNVPVEQVVQGRQLAETLDALAEAGDKTLFSLDTNDTGILYLRPEHLRARLADICGAEVTPKTLRTWAGTLAAFSMARDDQRDTLTIKAMAEAAADRLHNTPTIARNSYVHPDVIDLSEADQPALAAVRALPDDGPKELRLHEAALWTFLADADG